jgi:hypothetical protein
MPATQRQRPLLPGTTVHIHGLNKRPELNGLCATVRSFDPSRGRYNVALGDAHGGKILAIKVANISHIPPRDRRRSSPSSHEPNHPPAARAAPMPRADDARKAPEACIRTKRPREEEAQEEENEEERLSEDAAEGDDERCYLVDSPVRKRQPAAVPPRPPHAAAAASAATSTSTTPAFATASTSSSSGSDLPAASSSVQDADTEEDEEGEEEDDDDELCWPFGKVRCKYDLEKPGSCYQKRSKHLSAFAHGVEHVKKRLRGLEWTGSKGPLFRLLSENGLERECAGCDTEEKLLGVFDDLCRGRRRSTAALRRAKPPSPVARAAPAHAPTHRAHAADFDGSAGGLVADPFLRVD